MAGDSAHEAAARRDAGLRRVSRLTWRAGAAGVACSAIIAIALGHHAQASTGQGGIVVPNQAPAPAAGGHQVTSGAS
jgi:hypothetical protein